MKTEVDENKVVRLIINGAHEWHAAPPQLFWIPFISVSDGDLQVQNFHVCHGEFRILKFNCKPTVFAAKLALIKILLQSTAGDALTLVQSLWRDEALSIRQERLIQTAELFYFSKTVLQDEPDRESICKLIFGYTYHHSVAKIELLTHLLVRQITTGLQPIHYDIPKWKGKSMQFIELISIGIELDLFEGQNQNQICNSLLKAFQVDAESDQPIYKQRFNALFRRSKTQLPLIANYIQKVEESKQMKILLATSE